MSAYERSLFKQQNAQRAREDERERKWLSNENFDRFVRAIAAGNQTAEVHRQENDRRAQITAPGASQQPKAKNPNPLESLSPEAEQSVGRQIAAQKEEDLQQFLQSKGIQHGTSSRSWQIWFVWIEYTFRYPAVVLALIFSIVASCTTLSYLLSHSVVFWASLLGAAAAFGVAQFVLMRPLR
jgi:hypothetical protein